MFRPKFESLVYICLLLLAYATLAVAPAAAEPPTDGQGKPRTVVKSVRHINVSELTEILKLLDIEFAVKPDLNTIVLRGYDDGGLPTALKLIDTLDAPSPVIDVRVFILAGSAKTGQESELPEELMGVTGQLGDLFGFKSFQLLDTVFLKVLEGHAGSIEGGVRLDTSSDSRSRYILFFDNARISPRENGPVFIRLAGLHFSLTGSGGQRIQLKTDVEVPMGQKAVVGKSTPDGASDSLILVVEATAPAGP